MMYSVPDKSGLQDYPHGGSSPRPAMTSCRGALIGRALQPQGRRALCLSPGHLRQNPAVGTGGSPVTPRVWSARSGVRSPRPACSSSTAKPGRVGFVFEVDPEIRMQLKTVLGAEQGTSVHSLVVRQPQYAVFAPN